MISKLLVLPTPETSMYLQDVLQGAPMLIDANTWNVELGSSRIPIEPRPLEDTYRAIPGLMRSWYDMATTRSYWILPLYPSPEMVARHDEIGDAWDRQFVPFMVIAEVQNRNRRHVAFMNSVADGLVSTRPILTYHVETVIQDESIMPAHNDFYEDYLRRGEVNNELFITLNDTQD